MDVKVSVNIAKLEKKLSKERLERGLFAMSNQMLSDMTPYVPLDKSSLRGTGHVEDNRKIVWNTPYAKAQFYGTNGKATFREYTEPGTGKRWDLKAHAKYSKAWKDEFIKGAGI